MQIELAAIEVVEEQYADAPVLGTCDVCHQRPAYWTMKYRWNRPASFKVRTSDTYLFACEYCHNEEILAKGVVRDAFERSLNYIGLRMYGNVAHFQQIEAPLRSVRDGQ